MRMVHLYWLDTKKPSHNGMQWYKVCRNVALRSALGIIVHSLLVGAATGFGTTSVV